MTAVHVEVESIEHLDFATPCEIRIQNVVVIFGFPVLAGPREEPCEHPAVGVLRCQGCGVFQVACERHRDWVLAHRHVQCQSCGWEGAGLTVYAFEPLKVSS